MGTSINELSRRSGSASMHLASAGGAVTEKVMSDLQGPSIVATDYIKNYADQLRAYLPPPIHVLGTDGFGRSDSRTALREFFEVDRHFIVISALKALSDIGKLDKELVNTLLNLA